MKKMFCVLASVQRGNAFSCDVADDTKMSIREASAWLSVLARDGLIQCVGRGYLVHRPGADMNDKKPSGRRFNRYEAA